MKYLASFSILFFLTFFTPAKAQCWILQNVDPPSFELLDVFFIDSQHGWAVGSNGKIWKTANSGNTWTKKNAGVSTRLESVHFVDTLVGWAAGFGKIIKTTDGGETWIPQTLPGANQLLISIFFVNSQVGWSVGSGWEVFKTINGGATWTEKSLGDYAFESVQFTDAQTGWILVSDNLLTTTNGGTTWQTHSLNSLGGDVKSAHFVNNQTGWAITEDNIFKTTDGGLNWVLQHSNNAIFDPYDTVHFPDTLNGWVVGWGGNILRTADGGFTWMEELHNGELFFDVFFLNDSLGWVAGQFGEIRKRSSLPNVWVTGPQTAFCQYTPDPITLIGHSNPNLPSYRWYLDTLPNVYFSGPTVNVPAWLDPGIHAFRAEVYLSPYCLSISAPYYFEVFPQPNATISGPSSICAGKSATLKAPGGQTYFWSTGDTTQSIVLFPPSTTTYSVTVTGIGGCIRTDSHSIIVNPNPTANATPDTTICFGRSVKLTATGGGTYLWSTGQTLPSFTLMPAASTTYYVTVTNTFGCKDTTDVVVQVNPTPTVELGSHEPICLGEAVTLTASGGSTYLWNNGDTSAVITVYPFISQQYRVTVTDPGGCTASDWIYITVLPKTPADAGPDQSICTGQSIPLIASGGSSYLWNTGQTGDSIIVTPSGTTTYSVTVSNSGACPGTDSVLISVAPAPLIDAGEDQHICLGQIATLMALGNGSFAWNTGQTEESIIVMPAQTTTFSVTLTDLNGCMGTDEIKIYVTPESEIGVITVQDGFLGCIVLDTMGCTTDFPNAQFLWSGPSNFQSTQAFPPANEAGVYMVLVTNPANGCARSVSANLYVNTDTASISLVQIVPDQNGQGHGSIEISLSGMNHPWEIEWQYNGSLIGNSEKITGLTAGLYTCIITGANACLSQKSFILDNLVAATEPGSSAAWRLWPNPTSGLITVLHQNPETGRRVDYSLFNSHGCLLRQLPGNGSPQQTFDFSEIPSGVYLLQIQAGGAYTVWLHFVKVFN